VKKSWELWIKGSTIDLQKTKTRGGFNQVKVCKEEWKALSYERDAWEFEGSCISKKIQNEGNWGQNNWFLKGQRNKKVK